MNPLNAILVVTDFSAAANNAVRRAAMLAHQHNARLRVLHVIGRNGVSRAANDPSPAIDPAWNLAQARDDLRRLADEVAVGFDVTVEPVVKFGDPLGVLVNESSRASLVVLGQRTGGWMRDLVFGTPADRLLDACACPVLVVKQAVDGPYRRVLAGLDFTASSDAAVLVAAALAPAADLHFTHAFHSKQENALRRVNAPVDLLGRLRAREDAGVVSQMRRRVATLGFDSRELHFAVGRGPSASAILSQERAREVDVVAVGRQRRSKWLDALLGSVSRRVLAGSQADVLVVPCLPGSPMVSGAVTPRPFASGRADNIAFARGDWTIEADPTRTQPPGWPAVARTWQGQPLGANPR